MNANGHWPLDRLSRVDNFGHSLTAPAYLFRPSRLEEVHELFKLARERNTSLTFRGSGRSYGDAAMNAGGVVVDLSRLNRVLSWDPEAGLITVEPGVTIERLWKYTLEDGWWPPVVPGTMFPTLGGCLGTNIHGKNNWQAGPIGEHVKEIAVMLPNGEENTYTPRDELFYAFISGLGMLGLITRITLRMKRVYSGSLMVHAWAEPDLAGMLAATDRGKDENDYIVGWVDCTRGGSGLGRGQMHGADYLPQGADQSPSQSLRVDNQVLPDTMFGIIPKSLIHKLIPFGMHNPGAWAVNTAKYFASRTLGHHKHYLQTHVAFNFLLDYVPNWELSYGKGGLIQYQTFVPGESARDVFTEILRRTQAKGLPSYLGVLKRHRPDRFLLSHAVDGYSFAQDYRVTRSNRQDLDRMLAELSEIVLEAGGKFYFAKDSTLNSRHVAEFLGQETVNSFLGIKQELDPQGILESDLFRRCFLG